MRLITIEDFDLVSLQGQRHLHIQYILFSLQQFHLQRQRHNRLALMVLLTKTLVVVAHELDGTAERVVKLFMFSVLFLAHFLTNAYYKCVSNRQSGLK